MTKDPARSYEPIELSDLERLARIADVDLDEFFHRNPRLDAWRSRVTAIALAQGGAEHYIRGKRGIWDLDVKVLHAKQSETVRLLGVDAPEKHQAYGDRARWFTAELAFDRTVTVRSRGRDRNGRLLGEVVLPDGRNLSQELVRAGYAWWFRKYSSDIRLARLEEEARQDHRGLWADAAPQAPWEYRISGRR
jgi:endonuclease YncB( thermonuclease family)